MIDKMQMASAIPLFCKSKNRLIHENHFPHCSLKAIETEDGAQIRCTTEHKSGVTSFLGLWHILLPQSLHQNVFYAPDVGQNIRVGILGKLIKPRNESSKIKMIKNCDY